MESLSALLDETLPLNRKERFYTGTVLPGIVCAQLPELARLTALMGWPSVDVRDDPQDCGLVFFTEYGIAESAYGPARARFEGLSTARDTPDVVFLVTRPEPVLFALEAKMFDRPGGGALRKQLDQQLDLLLPLAQRLASWLGVDAVPVVHRALLPPEQMTLHLEPHQAISWSELRDAYAGIAPPYWLAMLDEALNRYVDLVTRALPNDDARLSGQAIVSDFQGGSLPYNFMGRHRGLHGPAMREDITTGTWVSTMYQVAVSDPNNPNWFPIADFVQRVADGQERASTAPAPRANGPRFEDAREDLLDALNAAHWQGMRLLGEGSVLETIKNATDAQLDGIPEGDLRDLAALYRATTAQAIAARAASSDIWSAVRASQSEEPR